MNALAGSSSQLGFASRQTTSTGKPFLIYTDREGRKFHIHAGYGATPGRDAIRIFPGWFEEVENPGNPDEVKYRVIDPGSRQEIIRSFLQVWTDMVAAQSFYR